MSVAELAYRIQQQVSGNFEAARAGSPAERVLAGHGTGSAALLMSGESTQLFLPACVRSSSHEAHLLAGEVPVFGSWVPVGSRSEFWHTDPFSLVVWPRRPHREIDYRPGNPTGDVRVVWELNRLQHLFGLARVAHEDDSRRPAAISVFESHLRAWHRANPPGEGVNYISAMEEALRLVSLLHAYALVRAWVSEDIRGLVADVAVYHARHVEGRVSRYSSAGNHTVAEAVGLLYAGIVLREHPRARSWQEAGRRLLRAEASRQIDADGGGIEQATWYLLFITDLLGLAQLLLAHSSQQPETLVDAAVNRGREFLNTLATEPSDLPRLGDADDGYALSPDLRISWDAGVARHRQVSYRTSGLSLVRYSERDQLVFLHNNLGMAPNYAHGHAGSLSLVFRWEGSDILIDPGTYQYGGDAAFRRYFRSTRAHNTATIGGADQAQQVAPFMWSRPYRADLVLSRFEPDCTWLLAKHNGFRSRGVNQWRGIVYREGRYLAVWDHFEGRADAEVLLHWHLGCPVANCNASLRQSELSPGSARRIRLDVSDGELSRVRGSNDPVLGWRSDQYRQIEPCDVLQVRLEPVRDQSVLTVLWLSEPGSFGDVWPLCEEFQQVLARG